MFCQAARSFGGFSPGAACLFPPHQVARAARVLALSPLARCAFSFRGKRPGQPEAWRLLPWRGAPFPSAASGSGSQMLGTLSPGAVRLFPPQPQCAPPVRSQEVFRQEPGPVCGVGGGGFSGAEFAFVKFKKKFFLSFFKIFSLLFSFKIPYYSPITPQLSFSYIFIFFN